MNWSSTPEYKALRARWYLLRERHPDHGWRSFPEWCGEIGKAPGKNYTLRKVRDGEPLGPDNWEWRKWHNPNRRTNNWPTKADYDRHRRRVDPDLNHRTIIRHKYGLGRADYDLMLAKQSGRCAICQQPETLKRQGKIMRLTVDHCHKTGRVRGLLCSKCNRGIGLLGDNLERIRAAAEYLMRAASAS